MLELAAGKNELVVYFRQVLTQDLGLNEQDIAALTAAGAIK